MIVSAKQVTVETFDEIAAAPENMDRHLEYIGGEIVEMVSNNYSSAIAMFIGAMMLVFVKKNDLGYVTGADGGYRVSGERYIPDVAFISKAKQPEPSHEAYNPNPPDLAVEVLSPSDSPAATRIKIVNYLSAGTIVWLVNPELKQVEIYIPGQPVLVLGIKDTLDGGAVLPGFSLAVKEIFEV